MSKDRGRAAVNGNAFECKQLMSTIGTEASGSVPPSLRDGFFRGIIMMFIIKTAKCLH